MKTVVCFVYLFLSFCFCYEQIEMDNELITPSCTVHADENTTTKTFLDKLESGKKVINFEISYNSKEAGDLTKLIADDYYADPNQYMWLHDGVDGLSVYINAHYNFDSHSFFLLSDYKSTVEVKMNVSKSCHKNNVTREEFLRLVYDQLRKIVKKARLPKTASSAYICYFVNKRKYISNATFFNYVLVGYNGEVLFRHCCDVKDNQSKGSSPDFCSKYLENESLIMSLQNYVAGFLFAFFPFVVGFLPKATGAKNIRRKRRRSSFSLIHSISGSFESNEIYNPPFNTNWSDWLYERESCYSVQSLLKSLFLFDRDSVFASRIRRSLTVLACLVPIVINLLVMYFKIKPIITVLFTDNIPLGYISMILGFEKSVINNGNILWGPYCWFSCFLISGLILINIPENLWETITYNTLHQKKTCMFLFQDVKFLERYGGLNISNLHNSSLFYAILRSSLLTALNSSFWFAVIECWFNRCKSVYNYFNNSTLISKLIALTITFLCAIIAFLFCVIELLICVFYYGCPIIQVYKGLLFSYTEYYIKPLFCNGSVKRKILALILFVIFLFACGFLFIFSLYMFMINFIMISFYATCTINALIVKPDALGTVIFISMLVFLLFSIFNTIAETYISLQKQSFSLAERVCKDFIYTYLGERFIYKPLFERIVQEHQPLRLEIAKAATKLVFVYAVFQSCVYSFHGISFNVSTYVKIGIIILTTMIPKGISIINYSFSKSRCDPLRVLETIYIFKDETNFPIQVVNRISA